jgi:two-component system OmpR family response regulator
LSRVLVVDDEPNIRDLLAAALAHDGFEVGKAATGREGLAEVERFDPDLIILDVMMPDLDGLEVCSRLRRSGRSTPVLFLTARDETADKIAGLKAGGDDYLTKPFSLDELIARIQAIMRRVQHTVTGSPNRLVFADLELDEDTHEVWRAGTPIDLTATEFQLLKYFLSNARRVLSKSAILDHVWQYDFGGDPNIVETYVSYLRKKIDRFEPPLIHTIRGVGYSLRFPQGYTESPR